MMCFIYLQTLGCSRSLYFDTPFIFHSFTHISVLSRRNVFDKVPKEYAFKETLKCTIGIMLFNSAFELNEVLSGGAICLISIIINMGLVTEKERERARERKLEAGRGVAPILVPARP